MRDKSIEFRRKVFFWYTLYLFHLLKSVHLISSRLFQLILIMTFITLIVWRPNYISTCTLFILISYILRSLDERMCWLVLYPHNLQVSIHMKHQLTDLTVNTIIYIVYVKLYQACLFIYYVVESDQKCHNAGPSISACICCLLGIRTQSWSHGGYCVWTARVISCQDCVQ